MLTAEQKEKIKYLKRLKTLDKQIDRNILELEKWQSRACKITSVITDMPRGSNVTDKMSENVANMIDINNQINADTDKYVDTKAEINKKIDAIDDDRLRNILKDRYINYWTWEEIAWKNNYSWQHVYRLHEQALDLLNM
jgi:DNA-directed RNA polymerase specialized sigma subunit